MVETEDTAVSEEAPAEKEVVPFERQKDEETKPAAARGDRNDRRGNRRSRRRSDDDDDDEPGPGETAFGDHIPAFLLRPAKVA